MGLALVVEPPLETLKKLQGQGIFDRVAILQREPC
jgi:hypothetical protein